MVQDNWKDRNKHRSPWHDHCIDPSFRRQVQFLSLKIQLDILTIDKCVTNRPRENNRAEKNPKPIITMKKIAINARENKSMFATIIYKSKLYSTFYSRRLTMMFIDYIEYGCTSSWYSPNSIILNCWKEWNPARKKHIGLRLSHRKRRCINMKSKSPKDPQWYKQYLFIIASISKCTKPVGWKVNLVVFCYYCASVNILIWLVASWSCWCGCSKK